MAAGWHAVFVLLAALTAGLFLTDAGLGSARRLAGLSLLAALCGCYGACGRRAVGREFSRTGLIYLAAAIPLTAGIFTVASFGALMLCILYPHIWAMVVPRWAIMASAAATVATAAVSMSGAGGGEDLPAAALMAGASLIVALAVGLWITRIIRQSKSRAALIAELAATRAQLAESSRRAGAAEERERLACDIHDTLTQGFASILLLLEAAEAQIGPGREQALAHVRKARSTARENIAEARAMIAELSPPHLLGASLPSALQQLAGGTGPEPGPLVHLTVTGQPCQLGADTEVVLLRAAQEALANVRKHAMASRADVSLGYQQHTVTLRICDDGRGFDPAACSAGFGLAGMRARAAQTGGALLVQTAPGAGTVVQVSLPLAGQATPAAQPQPEPQPEPVGQ